MKLKIQHKRFADEYLITRNAKEAALAAGYKGESAKVTACKLLKRAEVIAYIEKNDNKIITKHASKRDIIIDKLMIALDKGIFEDEDGNEHVNHKVLFPAAAELNKMLGYYAAEKHTNLNINADTDLQTVKTEVAKQQEILEKHRSEY